MNTDADIARSILARAAEVEITVDGVPHPLDDAPLGIQDRWGTPMFVCAPDGHLARAGLGQLDALISVRSDLRSGESLMLSGHLRHVGTDTCPCCETEREYVELALSHVVLAHERVSIPIDLDDFLDPALRLNTGFLRRSEEHLNDTHGEQLREAIARRASQPLRQIVAAQVSGLSSTGVDLQWITAAGAHSLQVAFPEAARNPDELGFSLRRALHSDLC